MSTKRRFVQNVGLSVALSAALLACGDNGGSENSGVPCTEVGATEACYTGAAGTEGVGACMPGTWTCGDDGFFTVCEGQTIPAESEACETSSDDNCNGEINEGCPCMPGATEPCYSGGMGTEGVGACIAGTSTCDGAGAWGACVGEVVPVAETCNTAADDDCDGQTNEEGEGCACLPGETRDCYTADPATKDVGLCHGGTETCDDQGTSWGACVDEVTPIAETCEAIDDEDCDGLVNEEGTACVCAPGEMRPCYTGPAMTEGVGTCVGGMETCLADGTGWGGCVGEVLPEVDQCDGMDHDCNGVANDPPDADGDGWTVCQNDCCDTTVGCSAPAKVNPGAFEFVGNGVDDDCDPMTSDTVAAPDCSAAADFTALTPTQLAQAMELCQFTTANPAIENRKWGVISAEFRRANGTTPSSAELSEIRDQQTAVLQNYGTGGMVPQLGATMAGLSTGKMRDQNDPGYVVDPSPGTNLGNASQPPAAYLAAHGGSLPASSSCNGNCPAGTGANDSVNVKLTIRVPTNAQSFSYKFRFISSEYWNYACTIYNDFYLALLTTGAAGIPADKNISFDSLNNPVSVNNGFFETCVAKGCYTCPDGAGALAGTGMQLNNTGGATRWLTTTAPIVPGETMVLEFIIFDVSDNILDSNVLLDAFQWSIDPSGVGTQG